MTPFARGYSNLLLGVLVVIAITIGASVIVPFVPALLWATVLSILTYPLYLRLKARFRRMKEDTAATYASLLITSMTTVILLIPFVLVGFGLFAQFSTVVRDLEGQGEGLSLTGILQQVDSGLKPIYGQFGQTQFSLAGYVNEHQREILAQLRQPVTKFAQTAFITIFTLSIAILTQFFMLRDGHRLREPAIELIGLRRERAEYLLQKLNDTVHAVFIGTVLVAIIQGGLMGVTYAWVGVPNALVLGVLSIMLSVIPLLGAPVIYIPVSLLLLSQGNVKAALIVFGFGAGFVSQIDNYLKPFFIGGRANLHPIAIFFSMLGGVLLFGPIGVMAGPMTLTILLVLQEVVRERLREPEAGSEADAEGDEGNADS